MTYDVFYHIHPHLLDKKIKKFSFKVKYFVEARSKTKTITVRISMMHMPLYIGPCKCMTNRIFVLKNFCLVTHIGILGESYMTNEINSTLFFETPGTCSEAFKILICEQHFYRTLKSYDLCNIYNYYLLSSTSYHH